MHQPLPSFARPQTLTPAQLSWQATTPTATNFDDVYFSREQGLNESTYVFLDHNQLPERWRTWQHLRPLVIGETGFGTGLNFLLAAHRFLHEAPNNARLHWVSTELHPLSRADLHQALSNWPEFSALAAQLLANYPLAMSGFHRLNLSPRLSLTLLLGDAASNLTALKGKIDAWCLDGFAPSKNPSLWSPELFSALAQASHAQTSFATFTAASLVRKGLSAAGFSVHKTAGFGRKREMLHGSFVPETNELALQSAATKTAAITPTQTAQQAIEKVAIIGAGLAGLATAKALLEKGVQQVDIYESATAGAGGSGNKQGLLYVKLSVDLNQASRFYLAGLEFSQRWLQNLSFSQQVWQPCGVLQLAATSAEVERQAKFLAQQNLPQELFTPITAAQASQLAGTKVTAGGLHFPRAGWVKPLLTCQLLSAELANQGVNLFDNQTVTQIQKVDSGWQLVSNPLSTTEPKTTYSHVIICAADQANTLVQQLSKGEINLPTQDLRGQVSYFPLNQTAPKLKLALTGNSYVAPPAEDYLCFGASFSRTETSLAISPNDQTENLSKLQQLAPELLATFPKVEELEGRAALRCTTPDQIPLIGELPNYQGIYLNIGHGSKGLASIPLSAELLASQLVNEPAPLETELIERLSLARLEKWKGLY